jgi:divalent metal cation (Fe/Co/Zn/Cd) transporter
MLVDVEPVIHARTETAGFKVSPPNHHPARLLVTTLLLSVAFSAVKFIVAWQTASLSVLADAVFSLVVTDANLVGLLIVWLEVKGATRHDILASRKLQMGLNFILCLGLALIGWEIAQLVIARYHHAMLRTFHLNAALLALGCTALAQLAWWLMARQGPQQRSLTMSRQVGRLQNFTTVIAIAVLPDLATSRQGLDLIGAGLILFLMTCSIYRMVRSSIQALAEA